MARSVPEWIGKTDDTPIPPRVKIRIFDNNNKQCCHCNRLILGRLLPRYDHIIALANGGENRESNIQLLCSECHTEKTRQDTHTKSVIYKKRIRHLGIKPKRKLIPGSKGSGFRKKMDGTIIKVDE